MKTFLNTCFELFAIIQVGHSNLTSLRGYLPMYSLFTFMPVFCCHYVCFCFTAYTRKAFLYRFFQIKICQWHLNFLVLFSQKSVKTNKKLFVVIHGMNGSIYHIII